MVLMVDDWLLDFMVDWNGWMVFFMGAMVEMVD